MNESSRPPEAGLSRRSLLRRGEALAATAALASCENATLEQGDPVGVHLPPWHLRVLAADAAVPSAPAAADPVAAA